VVVAYLPRSRRAWRGGIRAREILHDALAINFVAFSAEFAEILVTWAQTRRTLLY